ncbi:hypothetical protein B0H13DRAFT_2284852 [Mycena leptocephala]|nr:hypothetical protein B0H13DRAFT_2284852 [Mycena leptocephala]
MASTSILFSPTARVWNLRVLVLETIAACVLLAPTLSDSRLSGQLYYLPWDILFPTFGFILVHHLSFVFDWPMPCLAIIDLIFIFLEVCGIAAGSVFMNFGGWGELGVFLAHLRFAFVPLALSLSISVTFRIATIRRSSGRFFRQRFAFLGCCTPSKLPYTPMAIILNRSIGRPLVRGESVAIITVRAFVLSCIGLAVPAFGIYAMVVSPIRAQIYTRSVATFAAGDLGSPSGNATFVMGYFMFDWSQSFNDFSINFVAVQGDRPESHNCSVTFEVPASQRLVEFNIAPGYVVTIAPLSEKPIIESGKQIESEFHSVRLHVPSDSTPMVSGSHLFGRLTWIQRETLSRLVLGLPTAMRPVFAAEITGLQTRPSNAASTTNEATLQLYQPYPYARKLEQDSSDVSPLSGLSTFGGFWTFVNGQRPLSALGLIHIFQRNTLVRRWHADFPALRTEGGVPGSESAGVVAFIRERLIDIDEEPPTITKNDRESQNSDFDQMINGSRVSYQTPTIVLPLLDRSIGIYEEVKQKSARVESQKG